MLFDYRCDSHGDFEIKRPVGKAPKWARCPQCGHWGSRVFLSAPYFQEDRRRLFRNSVDGSRYSYTLGQEMPETNREYARALEAIGAEPIASKKSMPEPMRANMEYFEHVSNGGARDPSFEKSKHPATQGQTKSVTQRLKEYHERGGQVRANTPEETAAFAKAAAEAKQRITSHA